MEHRPLAHLPVPVVGMGTSGTLDLPEGEHAKAVALTEATLDAGSTLIDTSPMYGRAEAALGRALGDRRAEALVATKVWTADDEEAEQQIAASLDHFQGHVDLFQVHNLVGWGTRLDQLEERREQGRVTLIGATHWNAEAYPELEEVMRTGRIDAIQVPYNPWEQRVTERILPLAAELEIGVVVMRPFAGGGLADGGPARDAIEALAAPGISSWTDALLAWVLADPRVTCTIPATSHPDRVIANARVGSLPAIDEAQRAEIARLATAKA
jgi:aryl-alcohol dehydrogenase-like predicted oxidoreductase